MLTREGLHTLLVPGKRTQRAQDRVHSPGEKAHLVESCQIHIQFTITQCIPLKFVFSLKGKTDNCVLSGQRL